MKCPNLIILSLSCLLSWTSNCLLHAQGVVAKDNQDTELKSTIIQLLEVQTSAWNDGDLKRFMSTYWESEELTFSSGGQTTRGWQATMDRYQRRYSPPENMGHLRFDGLEITPLGETAALVLGRWHLTMADGSQPNGNFTLVLRKLDGHWKIVHDHSSSLDQKDTPAP